MACGLRFYHRSTSGCETRYGGTEHFKGRKYNHPAADRAISRIRGIPVGNNHNKYKFATVVFRLCEHSVANFDATLNNNHLQECLKRLLHFYDSYDYLINCDTNSACNQYLLETRPEFEALYLIFNLGNDEALRRSLSIPEKCKYEVLGRF